MATFWQVGLGPIGISLAQLALDRGHRLIGASDPAHAGADLGDLLARPAARGRPVVADGPDGPVDLVLHATVSDLERAAPQLERALSGGSAVISTCETLPWPWDEHAATAGRLDAAARASGGRLLGTGVNPGFAMDLLPIALSGAARRVRHVAVTRRVDAGTRRGPLQAKAGAGLSLDAWQALRDGPGIGHAGLPQSVRLLAAALGLRLDEVTEAIEPVVAQREMRTAHASIAVGAAAGVEHVARGCAGGVERLRLHLVMAVGTADPTDRVELDGDPPLRLTIDGGLPGDVCTAAVVLNYVDILLAAAPGLHTADRLPPPRAPVADG